MYRIVLFLVLAVFLHSCQGTDGSYSPSDQDVLEGTFGNAINLSAPLPYKNTQIPAYIRYETNGNDIDNDKATLGRVLFYDKQLSINNSISCASCHQQARAFSDNAVGSLGVNGTTTKHTMRLINVGFQEGSRYFWDERAASIEDQVLQPIKDHIEMGFSAENGAPSFDDLINKLSQVPYYSVLFKHVYGDETVNDERIKESLSHFVRSLQSFDSKFDAGLAATGNFMDPFANYTPSENRGKLLYNTLPSAGGAGCVSCHAAPEFAITDNIHNNGVIGSLANPVVFEHNNTRSPSMRDLTNTSGLLNSPLMHNGIFSSLEQMIAHYNDIDMTNQILLDPLLMQSRSSGGFEGQKLHLSNADKTALAAFLKTLSGTDIYTNPKWSNPFKNP
jgi:cytochrome c peroxidase